MPHIEMLKRNYQLRYSASVHQKTYVRIIIAALFLVVVVAVVEKLENNPRFPQ